MSENLDLVRSIYTAQERGDYSSSEWADPQIEYVIPDGPDPGSWKGLAAMAGAARDRLATWEDYRLCHGESSSLRRARRDDRARSATGQVAGAANEKPGL
jgi:hypothetical protein